MIAVALGTLLLHEPMSARIVIAVPVAAKSICEEFNAQDGIVTCVCVESPEAFFAVGLWYEDFPQLSDEEVRELLDRTAKQASNASIIER